MGSEQQRCHKIGEEKIRKEVKKGAVESEEENRSGGSKREEKRPVHTHDNAGVGGKWRER